MAQISRLLFVAAIGGLALWGFTRLTDSAYDPADHAGFSEEALAARVAQIHEARAMVDALEGNHPIFYAVLADRASETGLHDLAYDLAEAAVGDLVANDYGGASTAYYTCTRIARVNSRFSAASGILNTCLDNVATLIPSPENEFGPWDWEHLHQELYYQLKDLELDAAVLRLATSIHETIISIHIQSLNDHVMQNDVAIVGLELGPEFAASHCQSMWGHLQQSRDFREAMEYMVGEGFDCFPLLEGDDLNKMDEWVGETLQSFRGIEYDSENVSGLMDLVLIQLEVGREEMRVPRLSPELDCGEMSTRLCLVDFIIEMRAGHETQERWHEDDWIWIDSLMVLANGQGEQAVGSALQLELDNLVHSFRGFAVDHIDDEVAYMRNQAKIDLNNLLARGQPDLAFEMLRDRLPVARDQSRELRYIVYCIVRNFLSAGRYEEAAQVLGNAIELYPLPPPPEEGIFMLGHTEPNPAIVTAIYYVIAGETEEAREALRFADAEIDFMDGPIAVGQILTMAGLMEEATANFLSAELTVLQDERFLRKAGTEDPHALYRALVTVSLIAPVDPIESWLDRYPSLRVEGAPYFERGYGWQSDALIPY